MLLEDGLGPGNDATASSRVAQSKRDRPDHVDDEKDLKVIDIDGSNPQGQGHPHMRRARRA